MPTSKGYQLFLNFVMTLIAACSIFPFLLLISASLTDDMELIRSGYSIIPSKFSLSAYNYLWNEAPTITRAYGITILVTVIGTVTGLTFISMLAYPLSRKELPFRKFLLFFVFFTMLFNGGLVPTYLVYTQVFDLKNTIWALVFPGLLVNAFYTFLMRTFFSNSIPPSIIESAYIDGAKESRIFVSIVLPLSTPVLATVGLFQTIRYWNDWFNGLIYITDSKLYSLQNLLNRILLDIQFMQNGEGLATHTGNLPLESMRMAIAVIGILPILAAYPFFQKYFVKGITVGAVKG